MTSTCEFNTDKLNTIGYYNLGISFYGKSNKNLVKKATYGTDFDSYTYEYDSKGRVIKEIVSKTTRGTSYTVCTYTN